MMPRILAGNLALAVWLCISTNALQFARYAANVQQVNYQFGPFSAKIILAPLIIGGAQLLLWFRFYRFGGRSARIAAGSAGAFFALIVLVQLLRMSIDVPVSAAGTWLYVYFALSHLAYALDGVVRRMQGE